ncbi:hypothetical protein [Sphingopyxis sp.]|uniref:hypothetical protein n=1 Tax=Sphingopyxis sp. TaxID=1908224 RepID=UPI003D140AB7
MTDGTAILDQISGALDALATQLHANIGRDEPLNQIWGWNMPAITRDEFAALIREPILVIQSLPDREVSDVDLNILNGYPGRISHFQSEVLPNVAGGNAFHVYITAISMIDALKVLLEQYALSDPDWTKIEDQKLVPTSQLRRLRQLQASIDKAVTDGGDIAAKIDEINAARATAEALPADLQALVEAQTAYAKAMKEIEGVKGKVGEALAAADADQKAIDLLKQQAEQLVANTEAAQAAATTQGLGAAFDNKAKALGTSTMVLGGLLALTLGTAAWLSAGRIEAIHTLIEKPNVSLQLLWVHVLLTAISVAGPVWLAWILTKQIGQRFRLAEDYAFKASVAKAFEGYRREAVKVDPAFEKRLFASILDRLDEAPLRHVEEENHGSPWAELIVGRLSKGKAGAAPVPPAIQSGDEGASA